MYQLITIATAVAAFFPLPSYSQPVAKEEASVQRNYKLKDDSPPIGSLIPETRAHGDYPLDRPYRSFMPEERRTLQAKYEAMPEADEPPFPRDGMRQIIDDIATLIPRLHMEGKVFINVTVDKAGTATQVSLIKYPDLDVAKAVAYVLVKAGYKPAICNGRPCVMDFPFRFTLQSTQ